MGIATFDYALWSARYPTLVATTPQVLAQEYFNEATLYCDNTEQSPVPYDPPVTTRLTLLNMLVAHLAALNDATREGGITGRITSASQGNVSVSTEMNVGEKAAWFAQTQYGLNFWQASKQYRLGIYKPGPQPFYQPRPMYSRHR